MRQNLDRRNLIEHFIINRCKDPNHRSRNDRQYRFSSVPHKADPSSTSTPKGAVRLPSSFAEPTTLIFFLINRWLIFKSPKISITSAPKEIVRLTIFRKRLRPTYGSPKGRSARMAILSCCPVHFLERTRHFSTRNLSTGSIKKPAKK